MKPDGVRRSVHSARPVRAPGDAPSIGKVSRVPGTGLPRQRRRKRKSRSSKKYKGRRSRRRVLANWTLLISGIAAIALGVTIWAGLHFKESSEPQEVARTVVPMDEDIRLRLQFPSPSQEEALAMVENALKVRDGLELPRYFRQSPDRAGEMITFLENLESIDGPAVSYDWLGGVNANGLSLDRVVVTFDKDGLPRNRVAMLVPDDTGNWRIDFDAFARTVTPSWDRVVEGSAQEATLRVYVVADTYYNSVFDDDEQWLCVGMASPDMDGILLGYCRKETAQAAAMQWIFSNNDRASRAVVEVRRVEGAESRQFEITAVLAEDWVLAEQPFQQKFE